MSAMGQKRTFASAATKATGKSAYFRTIARVSALTLVREAKETFTEEIKLNTKHALSGAVREGCGNNTTLWQDRNSGGRGCSTLSGRRQERLNYRGEGQDNERRLPAPMRAISRPVAVLVDADLHHSRNVWRMAALYRHAAPATAGPVRTRTRARSSSDRSGGGAWDSA